METQQDKQLREIVDLLSTLGYDLTKEESKVFVDLIVESMGHVQNGATMQEVYGLINDKNKSPIYVELAYFMYEKGMPYIHDSLEKSQSYIVEEKVNRQLYDKVFKQQEKLNVYDAAFCVVKYLDEKKQSNKSVMKSKYKVKNVK